MSKKNPFIVGQPVSCITPSGHIKAGETYTVSHATEESNFEPCIQVEGCTQIYKSSQFIAARPKVMTQASDTDQEELPLGAKILMDLITSTAEQIITKSSKLPADKPFNEVTEELSKIMSDVNSPDFKVIADVTGLPEALADYAVEHLDNTSENVEFISSIIQFVMVFAAKNRIK